uniref:Apple domain-containing protein n=1 Tax=Angiostrongylus cantonensis TaxID=6313 RepID=A0A0K0DH19_ANGCA
MINKRVTTRDEGGALYALRGPYSDCPLACNRDIPLGDGESHPYSNQDPPQCYPYLYPAQRKRYAVGLTSSSAGQHPDNSRNSITFGVSALQDCVGVEFVAGNCKMIGKSKSKFTLVEGAKILMKSCVKSDRVCSSPFHFDVFKQKILVGFAREVVPAEDIQVCMSACLNSFDTFGFECESAMYYPADQECILNTEDRLDRPDLFADETEDTVIYMDNNCAGSQCYAPYITQYIAVDGTQLENELDRIINVDVDSCQSLCTQRLSLTVRNYHQH